MEKKEMRQQDAFYRWANEKTNAQRQMESEQPRLELPKLPAYHPGTETTVNRGVCIIDL